MLGQLPYYYINIFSFHFVSAPTLELEFLLFFCLSSQFNFHSLFLQGALMRIHFITVVFPGITQQTHQRWNNVDRQRSSTLFQRWYLVENESWADVHLSTLFQRWQNNVETTLIELRRFNVDEPTLFQRWNLVENESSTDICLSTLFQRWWLNFVSTLILGWKGMLSQRVFIGVEKTALKQLCQYLWYWGLLERGSIIKQN